MGHEALQQLILTVLSAVASLSAGGRCGGGAALVITGLEHRGRVFWKLPEHPSRACT